jgi:hypothetical protein
VRSLVLLSALVIGCGQAAPTFHADHFTEPTAGAPEVGASGEAGSPDEAVTVPSNAGQGGEPATVVHHHSSGGSGGSTVVHHDAAGEAGAVADEGMAGAAGQPEAAGAGGDGAGGHGGSGGASVTAGAGGRASSVGGAGAGGPAGSAGSGSTVAACGDGVCSAAERDETIVLRGLTFLAHPQDFCPADCGKPSACADAYVSALNGNIPMLEKYGSIDSTRVPYHTFLCTNPNGCDAKPLNVYNDPPYWQSVVCNADCSVCDFPFD